MYYAWLFYENRYKDSYLPTTSQWATDIPLRQSDTGWDRDYFISVRALDGQCYLKPPDRFRWEDGKHIADSAERTVRIGASFYMVFGAYRIGIVFSECEETDTAFFKYRIPLNIKLHLGREAKSELCIAPDVNLVSTKQGEFYLCTDGAFVFTDSSQNGSYLNGMLISGETIQLRFGDMVTLNVGIKIIYLGDVLAINRMSAFARIDLEADSAPMLVQHSEDTPTPSVLIAFRRTPRFLQKPDTSEIHIESPIDKQKRIEQPLWMTLGPSTTMILPMLIGTAVSSSRGGFMGAGLAMVGTASALAVFWGLMNYRHRKKQEETVEAERVSKYAMYIEQAEQFLRELHRQEHQRLMETCPGVEECALFVQNSSYRLWERMPNHLDFMLVRLGLGDVDLPNQILVDDVKLSAVDDPLRDEPARLLKTYSKIANAPMTLNLREEALVGILGKDIAVSLAHSILLQLAALQSYHDVRIAVLTDESDHSIWAWARWLPHVFSSEDRQLRMVVSEQQAVQEVLNHLDEVLLMRNEQSEQQNASQGDSRRIPLPHYVVFCTNPGLLENKPVLRHMLTQPMGMTLVLLAQSMEELPKECRFVLNTASGDESIFSSEGDVRILKYEYPNTGLLKSFSHMLAPLRLRDSEENAAIPTIVSFLNIYGVRCVEQLDIWRFWNENHVYEGLRSTIGLRAGSQPFVLDISDKSHGPHGLVAGTTGSGKSVMLQTYILSLAVNYHPDQIRFILIDYKGGGMADAFRNLPHVTGIIDNLQTGNTISRALASIQGEIHRREKIFRETGVSSIDDYIRFFYDDPAEERLPHLIIIVDEFAELKADQPDFMQELVSASRVGRSLGLHLILSTQKPSNSVSDEIWANSNFRICLRVQNRSDSMEMLHRPDAAYLKSRGRCYVQVGNDEIFEQAQTSYSGMTYKPNEPSEAEMPHLLDNAGRIVSVKREKAKSNLRELTEMDVVLERIIQIAQEHRLPATHRLWMDEMPAVYFLDSLRRKEGEDTETFWGEPNTGEELKAMYALGDDVMAQRYITLWMDLMTSRNHMIIGMASTGKTTMIQTLVLSFSMRYDPAALHMYILSLSSRTLGSLADLPHVGGVVFYEEEVKLRHLLRMLEQEDQRRRILFAEASTDSFLEYNRSCQLRGESRVPSIVVFVDRFEQVSEMLETDESCSNLFYSLIREASTRGIFFVVSAMRINEIPYKVRDCFKGVALQLNDRADYTDIVGMRMPSGMPDIASFPGRGLVRKEDRLYELQVALAGQGVTDASRAAEIAALCSRMHKMWSGSRPLGIPQIPTHPTLQDLIQTPEYREIEQDPWTFVYSYNTDTGMLARISLDKCYCFLIAGARQSGKTNLLQLIAMLWAKKQARICVVADASWADLCDRIGAERYDTFEKGSAWEQYVAWLNFESRKRAALRKEAQVSGTAALDELVRSFQPIVLLMDDIEKMMQRNPEIVGSFLAQFCKNGAKFGIYLFASVSHDAYRQHQQVEPLATLVRKQCGAALGGKLDNCDPWGLKIPFSKKTVSFPLGEAYLVNNGEVSHVIIPKLDDREAGASCCL